MKIKELLESKLGSFTYVLPDSPDQQLMDFYLMSILTEANDEDINYALQEAKSTLYESLKQEMLDAVYFSICCEFRHLFDRSQKNVNFKYFDFLKKFHAEYAARAWNDSSVFAKSTRLTDKEEDKFGKNTFRNISYVSLREASNNNRELVVNAAKNAFEVGRWSENYGGELWGKIADGWLKLYDAETVKDKQVWIDHVYDLQHNNNTVFDKVKRYSIGGYSWLKEALDWKFNVKSPYEYFDKCSNDICRLAGFVVKDVYGTTLESWLNISKPQKVGINKVKINKKKKKDAKIKKMNGGTWDGDTWKGGIWKGGIWKGGTWKNGTWESGIWYNGAWKDGTWKDGWWSNGTWESGIWYNGTWVGGTWKNGTWKYGTWKGGCWLNGTWVGGIWKDGWWYNGTWESGIWNNGAWGGGVWKDGIWESGTWHNGTWKGGTWEGGTWKGGKIYDAELKKYVISKVDPKTYFENKKKNNK
jgi:hypothetical protein